MIRHLELSEIDWRGIKERLPITDSEEDINSREKLWLNFDAN